MKNIINNKYCRSFLYIFPLLLNFIYLFFVSKRIGNAFLGIYDSAILFTLNEVNKKLGQLWTDYSLGLPVNFTLSIGAFSYLYSYILLILGFSIKQMRLILYFIFINGIFYGSWHAFFLIQKRLFNKNNIFIPFVAAFFYTYNLLISSFLPAIDGIFLTLLLSPYLLYILILLFYQKFNLKLSILLAIVLSLTINNPPFSFAIYIPLFICFLLTNFNCLMSKKNLIYILISIILTVLLASPFIYILISSLTFIDPYSGKTSYEVYGFIFPPGGILGNFLFYFNWIINLFQSRTNFYFKSIYGLLSSFGIWTIIITTIILYWKKINIKKVFIFIFLCLLITIFLSKGSQNPLKEINDFIYNINPVFAIFRTPGSKFGFTAMLLLSTLILFVLNINKKIIISIILILCVFMQTWIFFNQENIIGDVGVKRKNMIVRIPPEYEKIIQLLNSSKKEGRLLFVPGMNAASFNLGINNQYSGQDMLGKYIQRPIIYSDYSIYLTLSKNIINKIINNFDPKITGSASIRYIAVRKDYDIYVLNQKAEVNKITKLIKKQNYRQIYDSKLMTLFEIDDIYYRNYFSIKKNDSFIVPNYKKISPGEYIVTAKPIDLVNSQLIFSSNYHPDWVIGDIKDNKLTIAKHELFDNYANAWTFKYFGDPNNINKSININIYYKPQKYLINLFILSICTFIIVIIILIIIKISEKRYELE